MLGISSIRKIPEVGRCSRQREECIVGAEGFTLTASPTRKMDMSPTWLWHHCDLTYSLKIAASMHVELFLLTDHWPCPCLTGEFNSIYSSHISMDIKNLYSLYSFTLQNNKYLLCPLLLFGSVVAVDKVMTTSNIHCTALKSLTDQVNDIYHY